MERWLTASTNCRSGQAIRFFLPSGRVHALGKGLVIFEIQQNSDTTYRVFDWNRVDGSGKPRQLHIEQSLKCIDFEDFEPALTNGELKRINPTVLSRSLARHALFSVDLVEIVGGGEYREAITEPRVVGVVSGRAEDLHPAYPARLHCGEFSLIPAAMGELHLRAESDAKIVVAAQDDMYFVRRILLLIPLLLLISFLAFVLVRMRRQGGPFDRERKPA